MTETADTKANIAAIAGGFAILGERYAQALYELADQAGLLDNVAEDLRGLRRLWDESPEWRALAGDPRLMAGDIAAAAAQVVKSAKLNTLTGNFIGVVAHNRRLSALPAIIACFLKKLAKKHGEYAVDIRTARALSPTQYDALAASLSASTGGKVHLSVVEDASLLGGLTVKMGSNLIDASVKARLDLLERQLKGAA